MCFFVDRQVKMSGHKKTIAAGHLLTSSESFIKEILMAVGSLIKKGKVMSAVAHLSFLMRESICS
jgi:hypothetical protein